MDDERDPTVVRPAAGRQDPDATLRKPLWAFWRSAARPATARDATTVLQPRPDEAEPADDGPDEPPTKTDTSDDSDATVIRNTVVRTADATLVDSDRTLQRGTTLRPLPKRSLALPKGLQLHEYRIERVLGQGGFGITYLATDINLDAKVAIKEYLPEEIAFRANDRSVSPNASLHRDRYQQGLDNFLTEARTLASFRHPNIVRVARFFEAHTTAYMVLEYERGRSFKKWWSRQVQDPGPGQDATSGERLLVERLQPLLDGLRVVHASGYLHRDIKPDNIQVRAHDGRLVLLDFGSAGQTVALADQDAVVVTPGYAPIEQYGAGEQGAWTDLYALGATLYWAVAGHKPPDAEARAAGISMPPAVELGKGRFGRAFLEAIDWALQMDATQRPQTVDAWRQRLLADHVASLGRPQPVAHDEETASEGGAGNGRSAWRTRLRVQARRLSPSAWPLAAQLVLVLLAAAVVPVLLTGLYLLGGARAALHDAQARQAEIAAHTGAGRVAKLVASGTRVARSLAGDAELARWLSSAGLAGGDSLDQRLKTLARSSSDVEWLLVTDGSGSVRLSNLPELLGRPWPGFGFGMTGATNEPPGNHKPGVAFTMAPGTAGLLVSEPVRDASGAMLGLVVLRIPGSAVAATLDPARPDEGMTPVLVDDDGVVVHHPRADRLYRALLPLQPGTPSRLRAEQRYPKQDLSPWPQPALAAVLQGQRMPGRLGRRSPSDAAEMVGGHAPVPGQRWTVFMLQAPEALEPPLARLRLHLLLAALGFGLVGTVLALRLARRIVQPVQALAAGASALKTGQFEQAYVDVQRRDELGQLARTFNVTVDALRQRERERATRR